MQLSEGIGEDSLNRSDVDMGDRGSWIRRKKPTSPRTVIGLTVSLSLTHPER